MYWRLFLKRAHIWDFVFLLVGFGIVIFDIVGVLSSNSDIGMGDVMFFLLGGVVISAVFQRLKKQEILEEGTVLSQNISTQEVKEILAPIKRNFLNYFPALFFIINIAVAVPMWIQSSNAGLMGILIFVHVFLMFLSLPAVILPLMGRFVAASNICALILLFPGIVLALLFIL